MQVAGGLAALYPAGSVPISDAAAHALDVGDLGRVSDDAAEAVREPEGATVEITDGNEAEAAPQQPKVEMDSIRAQDDPPAVKAAKVRADAGILHVQLAETYHALSSCRSVPDAHLPIQTSGVQTCGGTVCLPPTQFAMSIPA